MSCEIDDFVETYVMQAAYNCSTILRSRVLRALKSRHEGYKPYSGEQNPTAAVIRGVHTHYMTCSGVARSFRTSRNCVCVGILHVLLLFR